MANQQLKMLHLRLFAGIFLSEFAGIFLSDGRLFRKGNYGILSLVFCNER